MLTRIVFLATVGAVLVGCGGSEYSQTTAAPAVRWYGDLYVGGPEAGGERIVATLSTSQVSEDQVRSTVTVRGPIPAGEYPWYIHSGVCSDGSDGPILGRADDYVPLQPTDEEGIVSSTSEITHAPMDPNGSYYITVHKSAQEMTSIVACGELSRQGEA